MPLYIKVLGEDSGDTTSSSSSRGMQPLDARSILVASTCLKCMAQVSVFIATKFNCSVIRVARVLFSISQNSTFFNLYISLSLLNKPLILFTG